MTNLANFRVSCVNCNRDCKGKTLPPKPEVVLCGRWVPPGCLPIDRKCNPDKRKKGYWNDGSEVVDWDSAEVELC